MNVTAWSHNLTPKECKIENVKYVDEKSLFENSDIISFIQSYQIEPKILLISRGLI